MFTYQFQIHWLLTYYKHFNNMSFQSSGIVWLGLRQRKNCFVKFGKRSWLGLNRTVEQTSGLKWTLSTLVEATITSRSQQSEAGLGKIVRKHNNTIKTRSLWRKDVRVVGLGPQSDFICCLFLVSTHNQRWGLLIIAIVVSSP